MSRQASAFEAAAVESFSADLPQTSFFALTVPKTVLTGQYLRASCIDKYRFRE